MVHTRLVDVKGISERDVNAWRELASRALEPNPCFEADYLMLCVKHFRGYENTTLVVAEEGDIFRAAVPIVGFETPRIPPRKVASTRGRPTAVRLLGTPLVDASCADPAMGALLDALHDAVKDRRWPGIVLMDRVGGDGPVVDCLKRMCELRKFPLFTKETWERGMVHRGGRWEMPLRRAREKQIGRTRRALTRDTGKDVALVDRSLDPTVVDDFLRIEAAGWKGKEGGGAFAKSAETTGWLREWHEVWSTTGRLTALCLQAGDEPVAIEFFVRAGDGIFCFRGAYDETYSKYGPGAIVLADCMEHLRLKTDAQWIDSSTDKDNAFLLEMFPERRTLSMHYIGVGGILDRGIVAALPVMTRLVAAQHRLRYRARTSSAEPTSVGVASPTTSD